MRRVLLKTILCFMAITCFIACGPEKEYSISVLGLEGPINIDFKGGTERIVVSALFGEDDTQWGVSEQSDFVSINPNQGFGTTVVDINVEKNESSENRQGKVVFAAGDQTCTVYIVQSGNNFSITTDEARDIASTSATLWGSMAGADGNVEVGFYYGTSQSALNNQSVTKTVKNGIFEIQVSGLHPQTTYYYKAFAKVDGEIIESDNTKQFTTTEEAVNYSLSLSKTSVTSSCNSETITINVTSNDSWTVKSSDTSWCTVSPASGSNNGSFTITTSKNQTEASRTATITVQGTKSGIKATVTVTQDGSDETEDYSLNLSKTAVTSSCNSENITINVTSNDSWTVKSSDTSWCTVSPASGSNNGSFTITTSKNQTSASRTATITVLGTKSDIKATVTVTQDGSDETEDYSLNLSKNSVTSSCNSENITINVTSNDSWTVKSSDTSWCTVSPASGSNNGSFTITTSKNQTEASRTATITVQGTKSGIKATVTVTQEAGGTTDIDKDEYPDNDSDLDETVNYSLSLNKTTVTSSYNSENFTINVTSNDSWTVKSSDTSWCTVSPTSGSNNGSFTITTSKNQTEASRTTTITVQGTKSGIKATVTVTQDKSEETVNYSLSLSKTSVTSSSNSENFTINVTSNDSWTVKSSDTSWCTVSPTSGSNNGSFTITTSKNQTSSRRTATVTVRGVNSGKTAIVSVSQEAGGSNDIDKDEFPGSDSSLDESITYTLSTSKSSVSSTCNSETFSINVTSNDSWTVKSSNTTWCTVSPSSGSKNGTFRITTSKNQTTSRRTATVTVQGTASGKKVTISVSQEAGGANDINKEDFDSDTNLN